MIHELQIESELAWYDELKSVKLKLDKNVRVSFIRICWGWFVHFIDKVLFCFGNNIFSDYNYNGQKTEENICNDRKEEGSFFKND